MDLCDQIFDWAENKSQMLCKAGSGLILGLRPVNERRRYEVTPPLIGWAQT